MKKNGLNVEHFRYHIFIWPSNSSTLYSNFIWSNLSFYLKKHAHIWPSIKCIFII